MAGSFVFGICASYLKSFYAWIAFCMDGECIMHITQRCQHWDNTNRAQICYPRFVLKQMHIAHCCQRICINSLTHRPGCLGRIHMYIMWQLESTYKLKYMSPNSCNTSTHTHTQLSNNISPQNNMFSKQTAQSHTHTLTCTTNMLPQEY